MEQSCCTKELLLFESSSLGRSVISPQIGRCTSDTALPWAGPNVLQMAGGVQVFVEDKDKCSYMDLFRKCNSVFDPGAVNYGP